MVYFVIHARNNHKSVLNSRCRSVQSDWFKSNKKRVWVPKIHHQEASVGVWGMIESVMKQARGTLVRKGRSQFSSKLARGCFAAAARPCLHSTPNSITLPCDTQLTRDALYLQTTQKTAKKSKEQCNWESKKRASVSKIMLREKDKNSAANRCQVCVWFVHEWACTN